MKLWTNVTLPDHRIGVGRIFQSNVPFHVKRSEWGFSVRFAGRWGFIVTVRRHVIVR